MVDDKEVKEKDEVVAEKERKRLIVEEVNKEGPVVKSETPVEELAKSEVPEEKESSTEEKDKTEPIEPKVDEKVEEVDTLDKPKKTSSGINPFFIIGPGVLLLGALLGGIVVYQKGINKISFNATPTPVATYIPEAIPTATAEAKVDLTKYSIKILNGSGKSGEAGKVQTILEDDGFKVSDVANASSYDYTSTEIQAKSDVDENFITKLTETLSEKYTLEEKTSTLSATSKDDIIVTVGSTLSN
ncbi:LytR C-terminal domain-containing protein [Patescibacteria group bacterium]